MDGSSELQFNNSKLDYCHKQIEAILHTLRMDMRHYKFLLMLYSMGIIIVQFVSIIMLPKILQPIWHSSTYLALAILVFLALLLVLQMYLAVSTKMSMQQCEKRITKYMGALWELHFYNYEQEFISLFKHKDDNDTC